MSEDTRTILSGIARSAYSQKEACGLGADAAALERRLRVFGRPSADWRDVRSCPEDLLEELVSEYVIGVARWSMQHPCRPQVAS